MFWERAANCSLYGHLHCKSIVTPVLLRTLTPHTHTHIELSINLWDNLAEFTGFQSKCIPCYVLSGITCYLKGLSTARGEGSIFLRKWNPSKYFRDAKQTKINRIQKGVSTVFPVTGIPLKKKKRKKRKKQVMQDFFSGAFESSKAT